jgi:hypothetical protein
MPDAQCTRSLVRKGRKHTSSHHRFTGEIRHSLRNGFNGLFRALPGDRAFLPPSPLRSLLLKRLERQRRGVTNDLIIRIDLNR